MALLTDILVWSTVNLLPWQRDALRRLFQKQTLDSQDMDDLYAMLKAGRGIPDTKNRQPNPLDQQHLPTQQAAATPVLLLAMRDLKNVNQIAPNQKLDFSPSGITVIYGGNASGKSGYSRVLKRACRARDVTETIHPNAYDATMSGTVPEATFDIDVAGNATSVHWVRDTTPPDHLSAIAVFDSRCARSYLDTEQDVAYLPYGLDIVENLGQRVLPELTKRLIAEIDATNTDASAFADLAGATTVGKLISELNGNTDPKVVETLAILKDAEVARLTELDTALAEADPKAKAKDQRLRAQRIQGLVERIAAAVNNIDDAQANSLKAVCLEAEVASKAEATAATAFRAGEALLPGTGDTVWRTLFDAARRYSVEVAYPGAEFPKVDADARCILCQQTLDQLAAGRMKRFESFLRHDTAKLAAEKRQQRDAAIQKFARANLAFGLDAALTEELKGIDANLPEGVIGFEKQVEARRKWLVAAGKTGNWDAPSLLADDPSPKLAETVVKALAAAADLDNASDETKRKALSAERAELQARKALSLRRHPLLDLIKRMGLKAALTACKTDLRTKGVSDKAKEFASQAVTDPLRDALNDEFRTLGVGHVKTRLQGRVEQGKMKHKLVLDLPVTRKLDEILSEGEQRVIAIGSFLAEMRLTGHKGGIVFDDPVSSLDHHWRQRVARRLVEEAKQRQVVVLTHDTSFLGELRDSIEQQGVSHLMHHLEWVNNSPGHVFDGLPWEHTSYKDRLDRHEKAQRALAKTWPSYPAEADRGNMRHEYDLLRATIERVIQDVVFNRVVQRYRDYVCVRDLNGVVGLERGEVAEIVRLYDHCNDVVSAHDPSSAKNASVPDPNEFAKDIQDLKAVIETIKNRRSAAAQSTPLVP